MAAELEFTDLKDGKNTFVTIGDFELAEEEGSTPAGAKATKGRGRVQIVQVADMIEEEDEVEDEVVLGGNVKAAKLGKKTKGSLGKYYADNLSKEKTEERVLGELDTGGVVEGEFEQHFAHNALPTCPPGASRLRLTSSPAKSLTCHVRFDSNCSLIKQVGVGTIFRCRCHGHQRCWYLWDLPVPRTYPDRKKLRQKTAFSNVDFLSKVLDSVTNFGSSINPTIDIGQIERA